MVQVLPEAPGFGAKFARGLGAGISQGMDQAFDYLQQLNLEKQKGLQKQGMFSKIFSPASGKEFSQEMGSSSTFLSPEQEAVLALTDPQAFNAYQSLKRSQEKKQESVKKKENLEGTLSEMIDTLKEGNLGITASRFSKKGRRDVQYFDTLGTQLESIGKEMVSKGVLSAPRFAYLLGNLPSSKKTDAANAGAIEAWAKELELEVPNIGELKPFYGEEETTKPSKKAKTPFDVSNPEHKMKAEQLYKKFKDKEKVRKALQREFEGL